MKKFLLALLLFATAAQAQDIPNHTIPLGRGPGAVGWGNLPTSSVQGSVLQNNVGADPSWTGAPPATNCNANAPITCNFPAGYFTAGINLDSNFATVANNLAFANIPAGQVLANATAGSAEPTGS